MEPINPRVANTWVRWADWEAHECLETAQADEVYIADLRRRYSECVEAKSRLYMEYVASQQRRKFDDDMPLTEADWKRLRNLIE